MKPLGKILVLSSDAREWKLLERRLNNVSAVISANMRESAYELVRSTSLKDAIDKYTSAALEYNLIIIEVYARASDGYLFLDNHILKSGYPVPPIVLISRFGEFRSGGRHVEIAIDKLTDQELFRALQKIGLRVSCTWPPLFRLSERSFFICVLRRWTHLVLFRMSDRVVVLDVLRKCAKFLRLYKHFQMAEEEFELTESLGSCYRDFLNSRSHDQREVAWQMLNRVDQTMSLPALKAAIFAGNNMQLVIGRRYRELESVISTDDPRLFAWFNSLRAELLWNARPDEALYSILKAMKVRIDEDAEPLGDIGDASYSVALRLLGSKQASDYDEKVWRNVLRNLIPKAARRLEDSPKALLDLEKKMAELSVTLEGKGHLRAAHEMEARSCELRKWRLRRFEWFGYLLLHRFCDYGNRPLLLLRGCFFCVFLFTLVYLPTPSWIHFPLQSWSIHFAKDPYVSGEGSTVKNFVTALYYSVVTFTTLGYGDITPDNTFGRIVAMSEAVTGFMLFGLSVAVASNRLRPR